MSELVDPTQIENIVGRKRHQRAHYARVVTPEKMVYLLHSKNCLEEYEDLRDCPFSLALDSGIDPWEWPIETPVLAAIWDGFLYPAEIGGTE